VSLGGIGRRRGPSPLRRPWWMAARVGSGRGALKSCLWCWILAPGLGSCVPLLSSSWWQGRRGSSGSWRWWSGFMVEGSAASPVALWCRPWWSGLEVAGLVASSIVFRSDPASLLLAGRPWRRGAGGSGGRGGFFVLGWFHSTQALWHGVWWPSSLQPCEPRRERQAVLVLEMVPPFNNFECMYRLILDGGSSVFLLASRGGEGEEASEVLHL
jgi:hypothetical protein